MNDPSWKDAFSYLWAILLIPVGMVWKKVDGAASREELVSLGRSLQESFENHRKEDRENFQKLFQNAEEDRGTFRNGIDRLSGEMHEMENRLRDKIEAK